MQFLMEQRRLAVQAEAQRKAQQQAAQQSFTMALMAKKQEEQALAQRAVEAKMQQGLQEQQQQRMADQFKAEQTRLQEQERARLAMDARRLGLNEDAENRRLKGQIEDDDRLRSVLRAKEQDERNRLGVAGHVGTMGEEGYRKFTAAPDAAAAQAEYDAAEQGLGMGNPAALKRFEAAKKNLAAAKAAANTPHEPDYFAAVDKTADALRFHASSIQDPAAKASYLKAIELWKKGKRAEAATDRAIADDRAERADKKAAAEERQRGLASREANDRALKSAKVRYAQIADEYENAVEDLKDAQAPGGDKSSIDKLKGEVARLRKTKDEIYAELVDLGGGGA